MDCAVKLSLLLLLFLGAEPSSLSSAPAGQNGKSLCSGMRRPTPFLARLALLPGRDDPEGGREVMKRRRGSPTGFTAESEAGMAGGGEERGELIESRNMKRMRRRKMTLLLRGGSGGKEEGDEGRKDGDDHDNDIDDDDEVMVLERHDGEDGELKVALEAEESDVKEGRKEGDQGADADGTDGEESGWERGGADAASRCKREAEGDWDDEMEQEEEGEGASGVIGGESGDGAVGGGRDMAMCVGPIDGSTRITDDDEILTDGFDNTYDDPDRDPAVEFFLKRCVKGKADKGTYVGSCRMFILHLVGAAADGQVTMKQLRKVFSAMEDAGLQMEVGMLNMCMAMVTARAQMGDATLEDGEAILEWFERSNRSMPELYEKTLNVGGHEPLRRDGLDTAYMVDLWANFSEMDTSRRNYDFNDMTDSGGNTLRSLYEGLVCVAAGAMQTGASREGASINGRCTMKDVYSIVQRMSEKGMLKDVETYNALLLAMAGAAQSDTSIGMDTASELVEEMRSTGFEPYCVTYGAWLSVAASCAKRGAATVRDGECILEVMLRRGVRPDVFCWHNFMRISLAQAENGVPTPTIDGDYVFDPMADAERIIAMMKRVTPVMYPDDEVVDLYLEAATAAALRGAANASDAWRGYGHWKATMASLVVTDGDDRLRRVEHWLSGPTDQVLYATVQLFNGMLSTADAAMRWELGDAGSERAGAVGVDAESGGGAAATQHLLEALKIVAEMDSMGVVGDATTRGLLTSMVAAVEARGAGGGSACEYARSKMEAMSLITWQQQQLREKREASRHPYVWWKHVKYDEKPPSFGNDPWNGLKS